MEVRGNQVVRASIRAGRNIFAGFKTIAVQDPVYNITKTHEKYLKIATLLDRATVALPDATIVGRGAEYILYATTENFNVTDFAGNIIIPHLARFTWYKFTVITDTTSAGEWKIDEQTDHSKKDRLSGLLYTIEGSTPLNATLSADQTQLTIPPMVLMFNYGPITGQPGQQIKHEEFYGGTYTVPAPASGEAEQVYICVTDAGEVTWELSPVTLETRNRILLARGIRALDNGVWKLYNFKYMPNQADTDYTIRMSPLRATRFHCTPNTSIPSTARINFSDFSLIEEGIGYEVSRLNTDLLSIPAQTPGQFYTLNPGHLTDGFAAGMSSEVDGNHYWDGSAVAEVPASSYTVQAIFSSPNGHVWRLYGQQLFSSLTEAVNGVLGTQWDLTGLPTDSVALAAWIIRGDQYDGSTTVDLSNQSNFVLTGVPQALQSIAFTGGGSSPGVAGVTIKQDGSIIGQESSVRVFDFSDRFDVSVVGDTVNLDVNGVATDIQVDNYTVSSTLTTLTLSKTCGKKEFLSINIDNNEVLKSTYSLGTDKRTVTFNEPVYISAPQSYVEATYYTDVNMETPILDMLTEGTITGDFALATNKVYNMTVGGALNFVLPDVSNLDINILNQIQVQLHVPIGFNSIVNLGTSNYFNNTPVVVQGSSISENHYNLIWEYDNMLGWVVGDIQKGGISVYSSFPLFTTIYTDYELSGLDAKGWGLGGLQFTPTDPDPDFNGAFNHIKNDYETGTAITVDVTVSNVNGNNTIISVPCYLATDGHLIVDAADSFAVTALENLYTATGIADFYQYHEPSGWVKLPRTTGYFRAVTNKSLLNRYGKDQTVAIGGRAGSVIMGNTTDFSGALVKSEASVGVYDTSTTTGGNFTTLTFDSSKAVNTGDQVDVRHTGKLLYFKLGSITSPQLIGNWNEVIESTVTTAVDEKFEAEVSTGNFVKTEDTKIRSIRINSSTNQLEYTTDGTTWADLSMSSGMDLLDFKDSYVLIPAGEFIEQGEKILPAQYSAAYNKAAAEYNDPGTVTQTEQISGGVYSFKVSPKGMRFYDETTYNQRYTATGFSGGFVFDPTYLRTPKTDFTKLRTLVVSYKNGGDWYNLYSDGWLEQGGTIPNVGDVAYPVTFLIAYADAFYSIKKNFPYGVSNTTASYHQNVWDCTPTGFMARTWQTSVSNPHQWSAEGYAISGVLYNAPKIYRYFKAGNTVTTDKPDITIPESVTWDRPLLEVVQSTRRLSGTDLVGYVEQGDLVYASMYPSCYDLLTPAYNRANPGGGTEGGYVETIAGVQIRYHEDPETKWRFYTQDRYDLRYDLCGDSGGFVYTATNTRLRKKDITKQRELVLSKMYGDISVRLYSNSDIEMEGRIASHLSNNTQQNVTLPVAVNVSAIYDLNVFAWNTGYGGAQQNLSAYLSSPTNLAFWTNDGQTGELRFRLSGKTTTAALDNAVPFKTYYYVVGNSIINQDIIDVGEILTKIDEVNQGKLDVLSQWSNDDIASLRNLLGDIDWQARVVPTTGTYTAPVDGIFMCMNYSAGVTINGATVLNGTTDTNWSGAGGVYNLKKNDTIVYYYDASLAGGRGGFFPYKNAQTGTNNKVLGLNYFGRYATTGDLDTASSELLSSPLGKGRWALIGNDTDGYTKYYTKPLDNTFTTYEWSIGAPVGEIPYDSMTVNYADKIVIAQYINGNPDGKNTQASNTVYTVTNYIAPEDGEIHLLTQSIGNAPTPLTVNGATVGFLPGSGGSGEVMPATFRIQVKQGDSFTGQINTYASTNNWASWYAWFVPYKYAS